VSYDLPVRSLVSQADASIVQRGDVPRSTFKMGFNHKKTGDAGILYPFFCMEVLPGDNFRINAQPFVRSATPLFPLMDSQRIDTHFFFVPNRIMWFNWVKMLGEQPTGPADSIAFTVPQVTSTGLGFAVNSLGDHLGLPTVGQPGAILSVSAFPFRAYNMIWNMWFRDENLQNAASESLGDAAQTEAFFPLRRRAKSFDYFTGALPAPQKFTAPVINSPISGLGFPVAAGAPAAFGSVVDFASGGVPIAYAQGFQSGAGGTIVARTIAGAPDVFAQASVNLFRQAFLIQQYLEKDSRGGTRYVERNKMHFGVTSPDARLQRPEYIGGGMTPLIFTPIAQTATGGSGLGTLGAAGTASGSHSASYASVEDGFIIGLISIKSELSYSQGIHKMWDRRTKYDFYVPSLAGLGEQAVLRREIFASGTPATDNLVFGYQARWEEMRQMYSQVTSRFRPTAASNIDEWHLSQQFVGAPVLGDTFIGDDPPMARVLAAGGAAAGVQYLFDIVCDVEATRPIPAYGTPVMLGRF